MKSADDLYTQHIFLLILATFEKKEDSIGYCTISRVWGEESEGFHCARKYYLKH